MMMLYNYTPWTAELAIIIARPALWDASYTSFDVQKNDSLYRTWQSRSLAGTDTGENAEFTYLIIAEFAVIGSMIVAA